MTIDEAIKENTKMLGKQQGKGLTRRIDALKLGIEALKYVRYRDNCPGVNTRLLLPGETEE